jgi:hypothetical protein
MAFATPPPTPTGSPRVGVGSGPGPLPAIGDDPLRTSPTSPGADPDPGGNLRGSRPASATQTEANTTITKTQYAKTLELDLGALPTDPAGYPGWRFNLEIQLTCSDTDPDMSELFVADMNTLDLDNLLAGPLPTEMKMLDRKLFKAVIKAVKPREHDEHLKDIQGQTKTGQGRHAVRVLDEAFEYEGLTVAVTAAGEIVNAVVKDVANLGKYVTSFKLHTQQMANTGHALPGLFVLEMVKKATDHLKDNKIQAVLAQFEVGPKADQTAKTLLDSLFKVYTAWKRRNGVSTKLAAAAKNNNKQGKAAVDVRALNANTVGDRGLIDGQNQPLCNYCGRANHLWKVCRKRLDDEKKGINKPLHLPKKAKAKALAAAGDKPKQFPPCPTCKKTNHSADRCFFKKKLDKEKEEKGTPEQAGGSSASGLAVVPGASIGNLLEQMLAGKLQKLNP